MVEQDPRRCALCGHAPLLLLVFADGLAQHARFGCTCFSVPLRRDEAEQIAQAWYASTASYAATLARQPASWRPAS